MKKEQITPRYLSHTGINIVGGINAPVDHMLANHFLCNLNVRSGLSSFSGSVFFQQLVMTLKIAEGRQKVLNMRNQFLAHFMPLINCLLIVKSIYFFYNKSYYNFKYNSLYHRYISYFRILKKKKVHFSGRKYFNNCSIIWPFNKINRSKKSSITSLK